MMLLLWVSEYQHNFATDEGFYHVGVAAGSVELRNAAKLSALVEK